MKLGHVVSITALAALIWFALLGHRDLIEPDEGRYALIPQAMVTTGDWITPRLNGYKYFDKPALQYWATAIGFSLFGESNASARLWPAFIGFVGALWILFLGTRLYGQMAGIFGFIIAISGLFYNAISHILTLDTGVAVFVVMAVGGLCLAQSQRDNQQHLRRWMLFSWAAIALAVLSKGLIGLVLPAMGVVLYTLWQRDWILWKSMEWGKGLLLFLAITSPWFIIVSRVNPEFAHFFFIQEHFERYTSTIHERTGSIWYFLPYLLIGVLPWVWITMKSLIQPTFRWRVSESNQFDSERFLWVFVVAVFCFFSLGQSKLPPYILPIMPILGLLAGKRLVTDGRDRVDAGIMLITALFFTILAWQITKFSDATLPVEMMLEVQPWVYLSAGCWLVAAVLAYLANTKRPLYFAGAGMAALLAVQSIAWGFQAIAPARSNRDMAETIKPLLSNQTKIYTARLYYYPYSLAFYLNRNLTLVDYWGEMRMGIDLEPRDWIAEDTEFIRRWENDKQAIAIMSLEGYQDFKAMELPMEIVFKGIHSIAVKKP